MAITNEHVNIDEVLVDYFVLKDEVQDLKTENDFLRRQNAACKLRCAEFSKRVQELEDEIADLRFTHKYLTAEEAGKQFAKELLGGA